MLYMHKVASINTPLHPCPSIGEPSAGVSSMDLVTPPLVVRNLGQH